jgi:hypothetical protein
MKNPDDNHFLHIKANGVEVTASGRLAIYGAPVVVIGWRILSAAWR